MKNGYKFRLLDKVLIEKLSNIGGVLLLGPKDVGKTWMGENFSKSQIFFKQNETILQQIKLDNNIALNGEFPRLIDEWQMYPWIMNAVITKIGKLNKNNLYILTGSSTPNEKKSKDLHSGAGRIARITLSTLTLFEMGFSNKKINFRDLFLKNNKKISFIGGLKLEEYVNIVLKGGWPRNHSLSVDNACNNMIDYVDNICEIDLQELNSPPNPYKIKDLMCAISRNIGTQAEIKTLAKEARISRLNTATDYLDKLSKIFILDTLKPWKTHIRSSVRIKQSPKWYYADPSIAVACLQLTYEKLWNDFNTFGFYFESLVIKELRVYANVMNGKVYFYKDTTGLEIDAIVETRSGWAAFEIKLGDDKGIEQAIKNFKRFKDKIKDFKNNRPMSFNIITAGQNAYTTSDGVNIIPLSSLYIE